jgi:hypothetical protein
MRFKNSNIPANETSIDVTVYVGFKIKYGLKSERTKKEIFLFILLLKVNRILTDVKMNIKFDRERKSPYQCLLPPKS